MECEVYACKDCGAMFTSREDFDLHDDHKGNAEGLKLKPLLAVELEGIDKALALFKVQD